MSGWIFGAIYAIGYAGCFIKMYPFVIDDCYGEPDTTDRFLAAALSGVTSLLWPFMVPIYILQRLARGGSIKERQAEIDARERAVAEREAEISRMERELGINRG